MVSTSQGSFHGLRFGPVTLTFPSWEPQLWRPGPYSTAHWYSIPWPCTARVLLQSWGGGVASEEGWGSSWKKDIIFPPAHRILPRGILRWASEKGRQGIPLQDWLVTPQSRDYCQLRRSRSQKESTGRTGVFWKWSAPRKESRWRRDTADTPHSA